MSDFDLSDFESKIVAWRKQVTGALKDTDAAEELEGHLRDLLVAQLTTGQKPDDAWRSALVKMGDVSTLGREFKKVHGGLWVDATAFWVLLTLLAAVVAALIIPLVAELNRGGWGDLLISHVALVAMGYVLTIASGVFGGYYALRVLIARRSNQVLARRLPHTAAVLVMVAVPLTIVGIVLGSIWAADHRGAAWSWDVREVGALLVVASQIAIVLAIARELPSQLRMGLAMVGSGITLGAWCLPPVFELHQYGFGPQALLLGMNLVAVLAIVCGSLVVTASAMRSRLPLARE